MKFAFLLHHRPDRYEGLSEDEMMSVIGDYVAWVEEMTAKGRYQAGEKLETMDGRVLTRGGDAVDVHEGPFTELAEVLGGFMIIEAADWDEAVAIAREHPHMKHNQRLEIRAIDEHV